LYFTLFTIVLYNSKGHPVRIAPPPPPFCYFFLLIRMGGTHATCCYCSFVPSMRSRVVTYEGISAKRGSGWYTEFSQYLYTRVLAYARYCLCVPRSAITINSLSSPSLNFKAKKTVPYPRLKIIIFYPRVYVVYRRVYILLCCWGSWCWEAFNQTCQYIVRRLIKHDQT
jgi:hypothetical protein